MILGITGGIGSGKSYISRLLTAHFAIPVYDSDFEARRLMVTSEEIRRGLVELIGPEAYAFDGTLCKPVVACYLFASEEHAVRVNSLVHPAVKADFMQWAASHVGDVAFESAILVEAGFRDAVDYLVTVTAPVMGWERSRFGSEWCINAWRRSDWLLPILSSSTMDVT